MSGVEVRSVSKCLLKIRHDSTMLPNNAPAPCHFNNVEVKPWRQYGKFAIPHGSPLRFVCTCMISLSFHLQFHACCPKFIASCGHKSSGPASNRHVAKCHDDEIYLSTMAWPVEEHRKNMSSCMPSHWLAGKPWKRCLLFRCPRATRNFTVWPIFREASSKLHQVPVGAESIRKHPKVSECSCECVSATNAMS